MNIVSNVDHPPRNLVIVDPSFDDYASITELRTEEIDSITLTTTAVGALRLVPSHCDAAWLINTALPDMGGLDLLAMLRAIEPTINVQLVANHYDVGQELQAFRSGARLYRTKPPDRECFDDW